MNDNRERRIEQKSGLNHWNAGGRKRTENEVYIPFPVEYRIQYRSFFPARDVPFIVKMPDDTEMCMKICQDNDKAIMSNPNKALGKWLLRDVLHIPVGEVVTYNHLLEAGVDSVCFERVGSTYNLDFKLMDRVLAGVEE